MQGRADRQGAEDWGRRQPPPARGDRQPVDPPRRPTPPRQDPPRQDPPNRRPADRAEPRPAQRPRTPEATALSRGASGGRGPSSSRAEGVDAPAARRRTPPPRRSTGTRSALNGAKVLLVVVSLLVLGVTGYAWANFQNLSKGMQTTDVISKDAGGDKPADGAMDILLVGMDSRKDAQGHPLSQDVLDELQAGGSDDGGLNTDTLILLHIPNNNAKAMAISFPRDSFVDIAGGYGKHKINSAYSYGKNAAIKQLQAQGVKDSAQLEVQSNQAGAKNLIATIQNLTGATIDHYSEVNLVGFYDITKAIGGVDVCLKAATKDSKSGANFAKGPQTVQGKEALSFVRQRYGLPRSDLDRIVRQQVFMAGMAKKMLSAGVLTNPSKLGDLITALKKSIVIDQGWDILSFAQRMQGLTGGAIQFQTIPTGRPDLKTAEDGEAVEVDPAQVRNFVQGLTDSADPSKPATPSGSATQDSGTDNASVTAEVRNASGVPGLAAQVLNALVAKGFGKGNTDNANPLKSSVVLYGKGGDAGAKSAAQALGGLAVQQDNNIPTGHVRVFLGSDYKGPGSSQGVTAPGGLALDGNTGVARQQAGTDDAPITANGVTCVN
ncbi:LytR family transcriptional regulator [Solihabitans fulvus]|uniref:LytR family transcriptional regulator n=1 Tax=Solihabitans fulvus TaxID=1892852 RepID=A0A5B2XEP7_9PSEU|nr:LCP family protein [Solihabitans fulvus]KAA2261262.1 LytR family transcriptional regulator [Solihabitans fulvus]